MMARPWELPLAEVSELLATRALSPVEVVESALERIEETQQQVNAFALVTAEYARRQAKAAEAEILAGHYRGPLHGIPLGVKDLYDVEGLATRSGSLATSDAPAAATATVVRRLEEAGMIVMGKTNTHEFALGGITPAVRNPWDGEYIAGGSSGGSAAAVASGQCLVATGTDTAGSIRIPAAACGAVGLKPTAGLVSRTGITPLSWSMDTAGAITRNVLDSALVLDAIAGYDPLDPGSLRVAVPDSAATLDRGIDGVRIGVASPSFANPADQEVLDACARAIEVLQGAGAHVQLVEVPFADAMLPIHRSIVLPEASSYYRELLQAEGDLIGADVRQVLEAGQFVFATEYVRAQRVRTTVLSAWHELFRDIDLLVSPTLPMAGGRAGQPFQDWGPAGEEPMRNAVIRLTVAANVSGFPSLALPIGRSEAGLPLSLQLTGRPFEEALVLRAGRTYERATDSVGALAPVSPDAIR